MSFIAGLYMKVGRDQFAENILKFRPDNISREGLDILFDYLDNQANADEKSVSINPVELVCKYNESSEDELCAQYGIDRDTSVEEFLRINTVYVGKRLHSWSGDYYYIYEAF